MGGGVGEDGEGRRWGKMRVFPRESNLQQFLNRRSFQVNFDDLISQRFFS